MLAESEITGDTVKSAVGKQIKTIFPNATWYKDSVTSQKYPNFFINQVQLIATPDQKNRYWLNYLFSVEYREARDMTTVTGINTKIDEIGLKLLYGMEILEDINVRTQDHRLEKSEGLLLFIFNVRLRVRKEVIEDLMKDLGITIEIEKTW